MPINDEARAPTAVATEVLRLWPQDVTGVRTTAEEAGRWPVFAMVVTEPAEPGAAASLFALLDRPGDEPAVVTAAPRWRVIDPASALVELSVHALAPVAFDLRILLPCAEVLGILDVVARGATIGITTRRGAAHRRGRLEVRTVLREFVLLSCPPSAELAALAHTLLEAR
jgi:hypothetical protein